MDYYLPDWARRCQPSTPPGHGGTMSFPAFFDAAPAITVRDPLARFLGAAVDGMIEYHYVDAVKLAGHSCPTVASAYLMTRTALRTLYSGALPERGAIRVELGA